ncbi:MAG: peptide-methionine (S)-S-oxide reductase MsrA [Acidithiobacillus sp.]|jgi:peptide-methionine (S)-S-oxide reductase|uniref:Peptide-methionine (S)-S-oxide reductase MsrA n=2 Tax=Acidithiobacillus TaxID=119977 RepID=A0ACD5IJ49_9PROT|nr:peptide-methionine (S)-S-oxide reductase MsrA [Acidithiobacillus ferruginosus]MBU2813500.1 peptide-methionine (S)-S-oxide reductase MsrA [Acidithiobacillus ferruginosus]
MALTIPAPVREDAAADTPGVAVLAAGCFWCVEAVYLGLAGVTRIVSGYTGGAAETANYRAVCTGTTGHAEAVEIHYDPALLSFGRLLQVFFAVAHDPTQYNRQGNDVGTQYRSAIFTLNDAQTALARDYVAQLDEAKVFAGPIATEITPLTHFYPAEDYHQDYARQHPDQPYICAVALPKVEKLRTRFPQWLPKKQRR